ncbi:N-acetylneuraminate synthase family protein [Arvimicrobium flavum]|uniref:N-acetylneuraminate synthase family protein n=1 Tax=Arvimicrobium flavum TaxID=3393320 RepID=UPI00237ACF0C|nr:N-acetylneuraminate synthase family protein [Mesorhizobium shangrilense]
MTDPDRVYFIAEAGVNHNGEIEKALALVDIAADAGADAVKFQTFDTAALATVNAPKAAYQERNDSRHKNQFDMLKALELSRGDWERIVARCAEKGVAFLSTPFDFGSADLLEALGVNAYKVSSGDLTFHQLLAHIAAKGRPMVISTGMATMGEVEEAVDVIERSGNPPLAILHCVSDYPCAPEDCNLNVIPIMRAMFGRPIGWSDHTDAEVTGLASVALGGRLIEKHFTLDRNLPGPDHKASLEPDALAGFIANIRTLEKALGDGRKRPTAAEKNTAALARRSIVLLADIEAGETLTAANCGALRPGTGLPPRMLDSLLGLKVRKAMAAGTVLSLADLG